jgi:hypothetical protein
MSNRDAEIEEWLAVLPYPLAAVLWRLVGEGDIRARLEDSMYFFEATTRYLAILALSGLRQDPELFAASRPSWQGVGRPPSAMMTRTTLGTWVRFYRDLSAPIRRMLQDRSSRILEAFCIPDTDALIAISSRRVLRILDDAAEHRNQWRGHDAGATPAERRRQVDAMIELILSLREALGGQLDRWDLIMPISIRHQTGHVSANAFVFDGPNPRIRTSDISFDVVVRTDSLYVLLKGERRALPLLPLLSVVQSDEVAESSVYFYDRIDNGTTRWLSYDALDRPERATPTPEWLLGLLKELDAPPADSEAHVAASAAPEFQQQVVKADLVEPRPGTASRHGHRTISSELIAEIAAIDPSITQETELGVEIGFVGNQHFARLALSSRYPELVVHIPIERVPHVLGLLMIEVPVTRDDRPGLTATIHEWADVPKAVSLARIAFAIDQGSELPLAVGQSFTSGGAIPTTFGSGLWPDTVLSPIDLRATWERLAEAISRNGIPLTPAKGLGGREFRTTSASGLELNIRVDALWSYVACIVRDSAGRSAVDRLATGIPYEPRFSDTVCVRTIDSALLLRPLVPANELIRLSTSQICESMIGLIQEVESSIR